MIGRFQSKTVVFRLIFIDIKMNKNDYDFLFDTVMGPKADSSTLLTLSARGPSLYVRIWRL